MDPGEPGRLRGGGGFATLYSRASYANDAVYYFSMLPAEITWFQRGVRGRAILRRGLEPWNVLVEIEPEEIAMTSSASALERCARGVHRLKL